jgi:hypothetical protein
MCVLQMVGLKLGQREIGEVTYYGTVLCSL